MKNSNWLRGLVEQVVVFLLRPRHLGVALITASSFVLVSLGSGFDIKAKGLPGVVDVLEFSTGQGLTGHLLSAVTYLMCATWLAGLVMVVMTYWRERQDGDARRVLVVELRGLVDTSDRPLLGSLPRTLPGQRHDCSVNVRPYLSINPPQVEEALDELMHIRRQLRQVRGDTSRANVTVVAGGVMHVPLQFYVGTLLDDEGAVLLYDWERTEKRWKALNEADDDSRFNITGLEDVADAKEVVLAVSASYKVAMTDIAVTFADLPVVHLARENPLPNALWSEANQAALTQQFLQTLGSLANRGAKTVHLVLAAPATLCIRFGMAYDHRNMPELRCYQRDAGQLPPYPWSVRMPKDGQSVQYLPTAISTLAPAAA
ncbi:SAVED domain-containing protein [Variovorax paradoxus]|uniref:SAVED domain-containing protein n=1 Tax=Variovorax paradoxus TaxID=34073 RepID=A0A5Q0M5T4_VARPD|nr:SAVED domain-containing protein [Variovorax paradoxus]QFZ85011.1 SAVED domain-containing protein [Variovorax paradoxus]